MEDGETKKWCEYHRGYAEHAIALGIGNTRCDSDGPPEVLLMLFESCARCSLSVMPVVVDQRPM